MVSPVSLGVASLAGVLLCLAAQMLHSAEVARLRRELEGLRAECSDQGSRREADGESLDVSRAMGNTRSPGNTSPIPPQREPPHPAHFQRRETERQTLRVERDSGSKLRHRQRRRNSLIHLVPSSYQLQGDSTIIHWQKILHTGESFEQNNSTIAIKGNGYYLIYTQKGTEKAERGRDAAQMHSEYARGTAFQHLLQCRYLQATKRRHNRTGDSSKFCGHCHGERLNFHGVDESVT
ncbi:uncharacterized protein LOC109937884 isoform X2 [Rhincodon typus]|uniref:uncharacterized protein LOC109937884 isoform X2 n=1 Tax=Rhincodon typus TaxID=259920 RepID=UPI00202FDE29|nr:uncharacterized protein LOC109937884 isoform X2 [Rhincodon typus]